MRAFILFAYSHIATCVSVLYLAYGSLPRDCHDVAAPPKGLAVYIHIPPTPYSGLLLSNKMQAFCWVWDCEHLNFLTAKQMRAFILFAYSHIATCVSVLYLARGTLP